MHNLHCFLIGTMEVNFQVRVHFGSSNLLCFVETYTIAIIMSNAAGCLLAIGARKWAISRETTAAWLIVLRRGNHFRRVRQIASKAYQLTSCLIILNHFVLFCFFWKKMITKSFEASKHLNHLKIVLHEFLNKKNVIKHQCKLKISY